MRRDPGGNDSPGQLLRWIAERVASRATCDRVLLPLLADLQFEDSEARNPWARRFVRARGVVAFWRAFGVTTAIDSGRHLWANAWGATDDEVRTTKRLLMRVGIGATVVTTLLLGNEYPRLRSLHLGSAFFLLIPSIIPVALPVGTLFAFALRARLPMAEQRTAALRVVVAAGLATFASAAWFTPVGNQEFRQRVYWTVAPESTGRTLPRGDREMTFGELAVRSSELRSTGHREAAERFDLEWHKKPALAVTCLAFGLAGAAISATLRRRVWKLLAASGVTFAAYALLRLGEQAVGAGHVDPNHLEPMFAMWAPVGLIAGVSFAVLRIVRTARMSPPSS